jgi:hypothetical protein
MPLYMGIEPAQDQLAWRAGPGTRAVTRRQVGSTVRLLTGRHGRRILRPVPPGESKHKEVRYLDIREDGLDETQMAAWLRQASALPGWVP